VDTVHRAVAFMGMSAVRNLVLCIGVRQLVRADSQLDFPLEEFWESSVRRASVAACVARRLGLPHAEEFFTLGLCQDVGILARLRQDPTFGRRYAPLLKLRADARLEAERGLGGETHDVLGSELLRAWKLPHDLSEAVGFHHRYETAPPTTVGRCLIALAAESIADLLHVPDKAGALEEAHDRLERLELSADLLRPIVGEVVEDVANAAEMLQLRVGVQPGYEEIVARASDVLCTLSLNAPRADEGLGSALTELQQRNQELALQAATDPLTGLPNRRRFDEELERELSIAERQRSVVSTLMIDIDHFKRINDGYGHRAGDATLRRVADVIRREIRRSDTCARFGGEEFAVILPFTPEAGARAVAERIRSGVEHLSVDWEGQRLSLTVSVGGVTLPVGTQSTDSAVEAADAAMYEAKRQGRNRTCWHSWPA
jgi:diguanylate cyclase (GGDEF)-like protein